MEPQPQLAFMTLRDSAGAFRWKNLLSFAFWRNMVVHFCCCSLVGRWLETPWCLFCLYAFGIYDPESLVWGSLLYPFCVYGVGAFICGVLLTPLADWLRGRFSRTWQAALAFYLICVFVTMAMEIGMGWMLNQPDELGNYPLWDNSVLAFNVLDQAWLPNDIMLGVCAFLYTWVFYPLCEKFLEGLRPRTATVLAAVVLAVFVVLCVIHWA